MRRLAAFGFTLFVASAAASLVLAPPGVSTAAADAVEETFIIPASDGYGVAECLVSGAECGTVVANAWCEAQGYGVAASFRVVAAEDVTGSTTAYGVTRPVRPTPTRISVSFELTSSGAYFHAIAQRGARDVVPSLPWRRISSTFTTTPSISCSTECRRSP